ncbi:MAG: ATP-binding cassette domain-containing protein [Myxococcota bacterium]
MMEHLLEVRDLRVRFRKGRGWVCPVDGVSFSMGTKEDIALIGASGSGKTLTAMSLLDLIRGQPGVVAGEVLFHTQGGVVSVYEGVERAYVQRESRFARTDFYTRWKGDVRKRVTGLSGVHVGVSFQHALGAQDPLWTVGETLLESLRLRSPESSLKLHRAEAEAWLARVGIYEPRKVMKAYPHELSGGMCQRVMIASVLSMRPRLILADEPTTGLDVETKLQILSLLEEVKAEYQCRLLLVTHELGLLP